MRESRKMRTFEVVLWLMATACSVEPKQITLPPLAERSASQDESEFDNPGSTRTDSGTGVEDVSAPEADSEFSKDSCVDGLVNAARVPPKVVLVLDGSCSMSTDYPANGAPSALLCTRNARGRWTALRNALVGPQGVVPKLEKAVAFGLVVFGTQPSCPIPGQPVSSQLNNLARIQAGLPDVQPGMNTPTGPALDWVYENMITLQGPDDRGAAQLVILATDGEPNSCGLGGIGIGIGLGGATTNYQPSIDAVKRGSMKGATTYVISLADSTGPFHDHLQQLANLGNPAATQGATLYEPASPDQLATTLEMLAGAAVGCEIELNGTISLEQACNGTVTLDGVALACNDANGWSAIDERNIRLQGSACERLRSRNDAMVEAHFACTGFRPD
jgi:hypothetical protein